MTDEGVPRPRWADVRRTVKVLVAVNTLLLVVLLGGVLWVVSQPIGPSADVGLTFAGDALLKDEAARRGIAEGQPAPGFAVPPGGNQIELAALNGDQVPLSTFIGRPVWVVFWATYCHACQLEEPDLRRAFEAYRADGLMLLAIDVGEDAQVVRRYAQSHDLPWTILLDASGAAVDAFGAIGTPSHYFIAGNGAILSRAFGRLDLAEMLASVGNLVGPGRSGRGAPRG